MIKKKYIISTLILSLLCMNKTYASCTQEEIDAFKKIENEYKVTYEFNIDTKDYAVTFTYSTTRMYSFSPDYYLVSQTLKGYTDNSFTYTGIKPGKYNVDIVGATETCQDTVKKITLELPEYNKYYGDPLCEGIEEFVLCQSTYHKEIDRETFESRINTYKKTKEKNKNDKEVDESKTEENKVITYVENNLIEIVIILTFIILITITIIITAQAIKKSRRLE